MIAGFDVISPNPSPKVSVCMTTYNHARFIKQAIESVLMQKTNFTYELVIGEDCSTDRTREIVIRFQQQNPERIRLLLPEKNLGMIPNLIRTLQACRGQYVALLEGDDYWTSCYKLEKQVDFLDSHPECSICFHTVDEVFDAKNHQAPRLYAPGLSKEAFGLEDLLVYNFMYTASVMFRNRPKEMGEFLEHYQHSEIDDWEVFIFNAQFGKIGFIDEPMAVYRIHAAGVWSSMDLVGQIDQEIRLLEEVNAHLNFRHDRVIKRSISMRHLKLALAWAWKGNALLARSHARTCTAESWRGATLPAIPLIVMWVAVCLSSLSRVILSVKAFSSLAQRIFMRMGL